MFEVETIVNRYQLAEVEGLCPNCGSMMKKSDTLREGDNIFTWLECTKEGCDGQWLQKKPLLKLGVA
jgi:hypothetical protein